MIPIERFGPEHTEYYGECDPFGCIRQELSGIGLGPLQPNMDTGAMLRYPGTQDR